MLSGRRVLVGVCGSIAAYKMAEVVRALVKEGASVRVTMTEAATRFVAAATFAALSEHPVETELFESPERVVHVELGRWAEVFVVGAASASTIARLAGGRAEDVLSAAYLVCRCPVILAPAMHTEMWEHASVQRNVDRLLADGVELVPPEQGSLVSGDFGVGRLAEPASIVEAIRSALTAKDLSGYRLLVTAGPTRELLDPVRFVSSPSSGRMGFAVAAVARRRGADVCLVTGPTALAPPAGVEVVRVTTAQQMLDECLARFDDADAVVKAAAVSDWRPAAPAGEKLKKEAGPPRMDLEPTPDVAAELGRKKGRQVLVVFAAETAHLVVNAQAKLARKNADLVVANLVGLPGTGFESTDNEAVLVSAGRVEELPRLPKELLASRILDRVGTMLAGSKGE